MRELHVTLLGRLITVKTYRLKQFGVDGTVGMRRRLQFICTVSNLFVFVVTDRIDGNYMYRLVLCGIPLSVHVGLECASDNKIFCPHF
jgi:hypothetical protein